VAHKSTCEIFAMKRVNKMTASMKDQLNEVNNERLMLTKLKHKSIVSMKAAWVDKTYLFILLDYALNGDLLGFL
jgi:serine/threonine protein kinase